MRRCIPAPTPETNNFYLAGLRVGYEPSQAPRQWLPGLKVLDSHGVKFVPDFGIPRYDAEDVRKQFFLVREYPPLEEIDHGLMQRAYDLVLMLYRPYIDKCCGQITPMTDLDLDLSKSPGEPWQSMGCKTKADVLLKHPELFAEALQNPVAFDMIHRVSGKVELLPLKKCDPPQPRTFEVAPFHLIAGGMRYFQAFVHMIRDDPCKIFNAYGIVVQHGGWHKLFSGMDKYKLKYAGDTSKWDKHIRGFLFELVVNIFREVHRNAPEHIATGASQWCQHYFNSNMNTVYLLPDGEVLVKLFDGLFNSGTYATTPANTIGHQLVFVYHCLRVGVPDHLVLQEFFMPFSDDFIAATDRDEVADFSARKVSYSFFGLKLKEEDDFVSTSSIGMTFLGFKNNRAGGRYVPYFDQNRILTALTLSDGTLSPAIDMAHVFGLYQLCIWDDRPIQTHRGEIPFSQLMWYVVRDLVQQRGFTATARQVGPFWALVPDPAYLRRRDIGYESQPEVTHH